MEINKKIINTLTISSIIILIIIDINNFGFNFISMENMSNIIANSITFISILLGFISATYVMIQSDSYTHVKNLLRKNNVYEIFNKSFKDLVYYGFVSVILLIILEMFINKIILFKAFIYIIIPLLLRFILISNNMIIIISKMIIAEEKLKKREENKY